MSDPKERPEEKTESVRSPERQTEGARSEALGAVSELIRKQREDRSDQKNPDRPPKETSRKFGRVELVGDDGKALVKGMPPQDWPTPGDIKMQYMDATEQLAQKDKVAVETPYRGELIKRDVEPSTQTVKAGDNLTKIATDHLGPGASKEEIHKHIQEIARLNGIDDPNKISTGDVLKLPGHAKDGSIIRDEDGIRTTYKPDGIKIEEGRDRDWKVTEYPDKTKVTEYKDVENPAGTVRRTTKPDGTEIEELKGGGKITTYPDRTKVYEYGNGQIHTYRPDGSDVMQYPKDDPEGRAKVTTFKDGPTITEYRDGRTVRVEKELLATTTTTELPDKKTRITEITGPYGTTKTTETELPDQTKVKRFEDKNGSITVLTHPDNTQTRITEPKDGPKVTEAPGGYPRASEYKDKNGNFTGDRVTEYADGTRVTENKAGEKELVSQDGYHMVKEKDGKIKITGYPTFTPTGNQRRVEELKEVMK